ncbi:MAG: MFS transporter [Prevotella sp.]|jgi:FHS family L-fucose permease-like MFS transporter|nr:MFS transporter [Prevotella sp.]
MTQEKNNSKLIAIITMCFIFAMISFVTNMGAPFGNIWGFTYPFAKAWGNLMNFAAYLFMGIPAGKMLIKYGYKKTALIALIVGIVGLALQYLSSIAGDGTYVFTYDGIPVALNLVIYLLGAFICGFCVCMLNTVVNPMLNLLGGGGNKGNQYIQIGGTMNSLTATLTPLLTGLLVGTVTAETSMSNVAPLLFIGMAVFAISYVIISRVEIPEPTLGKEQPKFERSPLAFRHCLLGVIAIFFYVGVEIGIPMELNFYITDLGFEGSAAIGGTLAASYWLMMLVGRASSSVLSGKLSTTLQMTVVSSVAIGLLLIAIFLPESVTFSFNGHDVPLKAIFIALCGLCTSIMWGGIFNLSVEGLGKYTEAASGIFMTMVVGGGIMPLIQEAIAKSAGPIASYWLIIAMLAYILFYSTIGCKNVNKDIPV